MNILETIIVQKKIEVSERKQIIPVARLEKSVFFSRQTLSLKASLLDETKTGIIAEFKRKSPSKGTINGEAGVAEVTGSYTSNGASGLSVLTDDQFFGGNLQDLEKARVNDIPILRKDFMIDEYQITEARSSGADVILLIAACLTREAVKRLAAFAKKLDLEVLLEIHHDEELHHICDEVDLVGVNNRDLRTFKVDIQRSVQLGEQIPTGKIKISESGISDINTILYLKKSGFKGFLIGENFMKEKDPALAFASFVNPLKTGTT